MSGQVYSHGMANTAQRSVRVGDRLWRELQEQARSLGLDSSAVIRAAVDQWLDLAGSDPERAARLVAERDANLRRRDRQAE
jgi:hypothetical protein